MSMKYQEAPERLHILMSRVPDISVYGKTCSLIQNYIGIQNTYENVHWPMKGKGFFATCTI